ncbi:hypothetical protein SKAU_G00060580 [Synaphobranchus kaupii]|uniref:ribonuclease H n=1 Tax=Synaphobranchus kaupii TaxID=118154 RepID=A0A9Q1G5P4_SYNKA|nr:hypothetical protein SKAU_G00060580 [Synaphobranchus kaupii]
MEFSFPPPSHFLALPGEPPVPWTRWYEAFETYISVLGVEDLSAAWKRAMLIHCLGIEGQRIFKTLGAAADYADCVRLLAGHFTAPKNVILQRILFRQRKQRAGESVHQYVADLRGLASACKFGALQDEMIWDQLAEHTNDPKIRERLITVPDDLTLTKAIEIEFKVESAAEFASQLASHAPSQPGLVAQQIRHPPRSLSPVSLHDDSEVNLVGRQRTSVRQSCGNCGSSSHATRAQNCPARGQTCRRCGKQNHFARVCRSAPATSPGPASGQSTSPTTIHSIHSVRATPMPFKMCTVELDGFSVPLLLDTGAAVSLLNLSTIQHVFPQVTLTTPSAVLCGYGNARIELVGNLSVAVRYGARTLPSFTFHVSRHGADLMGMDLFSALGFTLLDGAGAAILQVSSLWRQQWPTLFSGLGCLSAFIHQPLLNPDVRPVIQPLRCISLALRNAVTEELQKLLQDRLIEPVNASPWISNLYPLPTVEELTTQFYGATTFSKLDLRQGYLQVPLHPDSRNLTAFVSHAGVFRYARMPFGLSSAPSCFQKIMSTIFTGIPGVVIYLDDIVVHGPTPALHDEHLHQVLSVLAKHNLTLNKEKLFNDHGPLRELLKKDVPWVWTRACSTAVQQLKAQLTSPPVLAHFDLSSPTILTCDASNIAVGAVLSQLHRGTEQPIAFASRALSPAEQKPLSIHRWSERFQQYNFTPQFTPGRENVVADLLSCATPCPPPSKDLDPEVTEPDLIQMLHTPLQTTVSLQDLQQASEQDPVLSQLRVFIRTGWLPKVSEELTPFYRPACLVSGKTGPPTPPPLQPLNWPDEPWTHLQLNICGELRGVPHHQRFLVVVYDLHSKWPEVTTIGSVTTRVITDFLEALFSRWGTPTTITTDNGPQFISAEFAAFLGGRGVKHIRTALYHPEANRGVERMNQTLKNGIRAHLADGFQFDTALLRTLLHYRSTRHSTTGSSPALLMMGRELQLPLDRLRAQADLAPPAQVRDRVKCQRKMKQRYDRTRRAKTPHIAVRDWVRVRRAHKDHKLLSFWSQPMRVTEQLGPATFHLSDGLRWHASRLREAAPPSVTADMEANTDSGFGVDDLDFPAGQPPAPIEHPAERPAEPAARPSCARARPGYLKDFVTNF